MKDVDRHLFFDKVKSLGIDSCLYEIPKNDLVDDMSCSLWPSVTFRISILCGSGIVNDVTKVGHAQNIYY